jgi:hypothetical protein
MVICPVDLEICPDAACASGYCKQTDERYLIACSDCGELVAASAAWMLCQGCVARYRVVTRSERE